MWNTWFIFHQLFGYGFQISIFGELIFRKDLITKQLCSEFLDSCRNIR